MVFDLAFYAAECAPDVHPTTLSAIISNESGHNPFAIGVVDGRLERQPKNIKEAVATAESLEKQGFNFSVGVMQINRYNLSPLKLTYESAFEPCNNLRGGAQILNKCYVKASEVRNNSQDALRAAFSCYYSGNFQTGFRSENGKLSYVQKVVAEAAKVDAAPIQVVAEAAEVEAAPIRVIKEDVVKSGAPQPAVPKIIQSPDDLPEELITALSATPRTSIPEKYNGFGLDGAKDSDAPYDGFAGRETGQDPYDGFDVGAE
jgi:type IV secretion system protein VirB1